MMIEIRDRARDRARGRNGVGRKWGLEVDIGIEGEVELKR